MSNAVIFEERVRVPFVATLAEFRAWVHSGEFPDRGRIDYLAGEIEVDMSPEQFFTHGTLKTEISSMLYGRVKKLDLGHVVIDRTRICSPAASLSCEPDIVFLSHATLDRGAAKLVPAASDDPDSYIEVEGAPDLVVEIVSDSSVGKDTKRLPGLYFKAGVRELWLIDARRDPLVFKIHRRGKSGFVAMPTDADGYQRSSVMSCRYQLHRRRDRRGWPLYELLERDA